MLAAKYRRPTATTAHNRFNQVGSTLDLKNITKHAFSFTYLIGSIELLQRDPVATGQEREILRAINGTQFQSTSENVPFKPGQRANIQFSGN